MEAEFGRNEVRAVLERDAERTLRFGAPLFAVFHLLEAYSHRADGVSLRLILPLASACLLSGLTIYLWKSSAPLRHASIWVLIPWAVSIASSMTHLSVDPHATIAFVTLTLIASAALLLPLESFGVALVGSMLALVESLSVLPEIQSASRVMIPAFSLSVALLVYGSRRQGLISAEQARFFERQLHKKQAELVLLRHERE